LLPAGAIWPGGDCTHWKSAALSRRTVKTDVTLLFRMQMTLKAMQPVLW
jgi:hypothetical protein